MCANGFSPRKMQNVPVNTHAALFHIHLKLEAMLITVTNCGMSMP